MIKQINLYLESYGISNFLFYKVPQDSEVAIEQIDSLKTSHIPGILPCIAMERDEQIYIRHDLVSGRNIKMLFEKPTSKERLSKCLLQIVETFIYAEKQGLALENFVLDYNYIYIDNFSGRPLFIYLPIKNHDFEKMPLEDFFLELMRIAPYNEEDDVYFFIKAHNYLVRIKELNLEEFRKNLQVFASKTNKASVTSEYEKFYSPGTSEPASQGTITSHYSSSKSDKKTGQKLEIEEEVQYKRITRTELGDKESILSGGTSINIVPNIGTSVSIDKDNNEGEGTTVLGAIRNIDDEEEGTMALGVANYQAPKPFILALARNEKIIISKDAFKIGRDPNQTDYTTDNKVVGRVHALLLTEKGEYFFEDQHSTNGSFVNDKRLSKGEKVKIKHDDRIKLANEEFLFKLF